MRFYERKEVKDALAYLKLLLEPADDVSLRRIINVPPRGIGRKVMEALEDSAATGTGLSLWERLVRAVDEQTVTPRAVAALERFRALRTALAATAGTEPASVTLERTLDQTGYVRALRDAATEESEGRLANLMELVAAARDYELRAPEPSLAGFVDQVSLRSEADEEEGAADAAVWLMTLHAAKGLEFPLVVLTGMEEGLFPHARSADDASELEEERRLCYVGDYPRPVAARPDQRRPAPDVRRVPGHGPVAFSARDSPRAARDGRLAPGTRPPGPRARPPPGGA